MDQLSLQALAALKDSDPSKLDLALLDPLKKQLAAMGDPAEMPPEQADQFSALQEAVETLVNEQITRVNALAKEKTEDWLKAVKAKKPIEDRWIDDERRFMGKRRIKDSKAYPADSAGKLGEDPIVSHATRSRVLMCWGRLCDMMLPANDFPMRVDAADDPDPNEFPQLQEAIQKALQAAQSQPPQPGQPPAPPPDPHALLPEISEKAAGCMQTRVFQMLRDAKFQSHARKMLFDTARIGCGLLKGPFPQMKQTRKFGQGGEFNIQETATAGVSYVNPWMFWYDMSPTLERASATYEVQILSARELTDFKRYPRTIASNIDTLLKDPDPKLKDEFRASVERRNQQTDMCEPLDNVYAVLETHAVLTPEKLEEIGIDWPHEDLPVLHIWSCDGLCIKFKLSPLERDFRLDYYNTTIMPADDTIFGFGYSYMCAAAQRFADGAMNATLANAAASVAPMLLVAQGKVHPNREQWRIAGLNVLSVENQDGPLENFMQSVQVASNVEQNLALFKVAEDMMDQDTLYGQIMQGNANGEEMPASGLVLSANIQGVFQKAIAAYADDNCFQPLCERMIWWQKLYGDDPECAGDMVAKGIAATQLVSKDLALQHTQVAMQFLAQPQFAGFSDSYSLAQAFIGNIDGLPNKDAILFDRDKAMASQAAIQQQQQQGDPAAAAKIASDEKIAQMKIQAELQMQQNEIQKELQIEQMRKEIAQMGLQLGVVELSNKKGIAITEIEAELQQFQAAEATKRSNATMEQTVKANIEMQKLHAPVGERPYSAKD